MPPRGKVERTTFLPQRLRTEMDDVASGSGTEAGQRDRTRLTQRRRPSVRKAERAAARAAKAARKAVEQAGLSLDQVDLIIVATATPDLTFPATATRWLPTSLRSWLSGG